MHSKKLFESIKASLGTVYESRVNDDDTALSELEEAQSCLKQAIRHIETAQNYDSQNDSDKLAERVISLIKDLIGDPQGPYDDQPMYSVQAIANRISGAGYEDEDGLEYGPGPARDPSKV